MTRGNSKSISSGHHNSSIIFWTVSESLGHLYLKYYDFLCVTNDVAMLFQYGTYITDLQKWTSFTVTSFQFHAFNSSVIALGLLYS